MIFIMKKFVFSLLVLLLSVSIAGAVEPVKPTGGDKCPVCGMFVSKYPDFLSELIFIDGSYAVFDGAKDMFHYYLDMRKYGDQKIKDVQAVYVTDYYSLSMVDGRKAIYVIGSNVLGPMGRELIPFAKMEDAEEFMTDHRGDKRLSFDEITLELVKGLDR